MVMVVMKIFFHSFRIIKSIDYYCKNRLFADVVVTGIRMCFYSNNNDVRKTNDKRRKKRSNVKILFYERFYQNQINHINNTDKSKSLNGDVNVFVFLRKTNQNMIFFLMFLFSFCCCFYSI